MKTLEQYPNYAVSEDGAVVNTRHNRVLKPYVSASTGYLYITLRHEDGKFRPTPLHRLLAMTFIPNPNNLPQVNHKDGNKGNCVVGNLEWTDNRGNVQHAYDNGLTPKGADRYNNVHPVQAIHEVCDLLQEGMLSMTCIAAVTGVQYNTVKQIKYRKQWKDIGKLYSW